jgi:hypothetical protein
LGQRPIWVDSAPAGGSLYSGALKSSSAHRRKVLLTGGLFSRWWLPLQWSAQIIQLAQAEGLVNRQVLLPQVAPSTVEHSDHPARTGGRSQQVGSAPAGDSLYSEAHKSSSAHSRKVSSTGRSRRQVGSSPASGSLYSGALRSSSSHRQNVLSTGRFFSRCWLLYSGAR